MRKNTYLAICFVIGIFYILFVLLNTKASLFAGDICNGQLCNDIFEYIRIASVSFIVMLPILITGPFYRFFKKSVFIYFCFLIFIFIFGDLHTSGFNFNIEYMVEVLAICFSLFLFVSLALVHLYMITKNGFMKYIKEFKTESNMLTFSFWSLFVILSFFYLIYAGDMSYHCYKGDCRRFYMLSFFELISFYLVSSLPLINAKKIK